MAITSLGDLAQSYVLRQQNARLKADLQRQSLELSTGRTSDIGKAVAGDFSPLAGLERSISRLGAFKVATTEAGLFADTMQTALGGIGDAAATLGPQAMAAAAAGGQPAQVNAIGAEAHAKLGAALAALNTRVGDRTLFAGTATDGAAVADADTILSALITATAGATSAADVATAVGTWFDDPAGFGTVGYLGSDDMLAPVRIGEGESARLEITAADPTIVDTLKGLAMAALLDRGALAGNATERAALARKAGETLLQGETARAGLSAALGTEQQRIDEVATRNAAESSSLQIARSDILSVDPYETATALQATQTQLETLYSITAQISRLSLVDYLR